MYNMISLISPDLEKMEQIIAAEVVTPAVERILLQVGHTVVWVEVDIDTVVPLPGQCWALVEVFDIPARRVDKVDLFAGAAEVEADLP